MPKFRIVEDISQWEDVCTRFYVEREIADDRWVRHIEHPMGLKQAKAIITNGGNQFKVVTQ